MTSPAGKLFVAANTAYKAAEFAENVRKVAKIADKCCDKIREKASDLSGDNRAAVMSLGMRHEDTIKKLHLELESAAKKTMLEGVKNKVLKPIADLYTAGLKAGVSEALCDAAREIGTKKSERTLTGGQIFTKLGQDTWDSVASFEAPLLNEC